MGRGRQKAKQKKIARKLKYLTTDTDYGELAKELSVQEPGSASVGPFADDDHAAESAKEAQPSAQEPAEEDLDEYARWAAEAAAKATSGELPVVKPRRKAPHMPHMPVPKPSALKKPKHD
ncbi:DUF3073 domain-containing protein [Bifidobacterium mongoliense]|uniref:DUF3073 domain-containing protein n=1 Tax=Bifidobacterium mongoliense DSM 21395 TaxID=1437603 RepID=A0A087C209_9BIFI|nr:DUF3073 domain-containing protein [Bifidobacterium mongoliense]KFI77309.1 hypothetical protein BMON_0998 [Bifidobacterium mongoliense DSM 21395]